MLDPKLSRRRAAMAVAVLAVLVAGYPAPAPAQYADRLVQVARSSWRPEQQHSELDDAKFKDVALDGDRGLAGGCPGCARGAGDTRRDYGGLSNAGGLRVIADPRAFGRRFRQCVEGRRQHRGSFRKGPHPLVRSRQNRPWQAMRLAPRKRSSWRCKLPPLSGTPTAKPLVLIDISEALARARAFRGLSDRQHHRGRLARGYARSPKTGQGLTLQGWKTIATIADAAAKAFAWREIATQRQRAGDLAGAASAPVQALAAPPPARSVPARRGEADQVQSRTWHQGCQPLHELQRAHAQVRGAIAPLCLELWLHLAGGVELHPLVGSSGRVMQRHRCSRVCARRRLSARPPAGWNR